MSLSYWPEVESVRQCIRTEAEELSDAALLAVHEPMMLRKSPARETGGNLVSESELLEHVMKSNRPTPILGESGFGKSHIIRWLDAQLHRKNGEDKFHIVRIPKNASIRQTLSIILAGLEGQIFDEARAKVGSVGEFLNTREVAEILLVFLNSHLEELYSSAMKQRNDARAQGVNLDSAEQERIRTISRHCAQNKLPALVGDSYFKKQLIEQGKCIYQIAKRMTEGTNSDEIEHFSFRIERSEIDFQTNIDDFSLEARIYIRDAQLNTSEPIQDEAVELLNDCLGDACRKAFQQIFQFDGGSFQDLFREIRIQLLKEDKILFVLVEDMAAISAIEDVLIDSLLEEDSPGGHQVLCSLHSAIAVTSGYDGYVKRRDTVSTRAQFEWYIEGSMGSAKEIHQRISSFCGRYLNAARFGEGVLAQLLKETDLESVDFPGIWESDDEDQVHAAKVFGASKSGFSLFPYSENALRCLADQYCKPSGTLEFNPRKILQHVLREPLISYRDHYSEGKFPLEGFADVDCPTNLQSQLRLVMPPEELGRAETLAAIWGYGAMSLNELAAKMSPSIALEFGLERLAEKLEDTSPERDDHEEPVEQLVNPVVPTNPSVIDSYSIEKKVDDYFRKKVIPQSEANEVRKALYEHIESRKEDHTLWYAFSKWPDLKSGQRYRIALPFSSHNIDNCLLSFGTDKEFVSRRNSLKYKQFIIAVLRKKESGNTWSHPGGVEDYANYQRVLDEWVPAAIERLVSDARLVANEKLIEALKLGLVIDPKMDGKSFNETVNTIVLSKDALEDKFNTKTGLEDWDSYLQSEFLPNWEKTQENWLWAYATKSRASRHAIEADLIKKALRGNAVKNIPPGVLRKAQLAHRTYCDTYPNLQLLSECTEKEQFYSLMKYFLQVLDKTSSGGQFQDMEETTARKFGNKIKKIIQDEQWSQIVSNLRLSREFNSEASVVALSAVDPKFAGQIDDVLEIWRIFRERNVQRILNENRELGADARKELETGLSTVIGKFREHVFAGISQDKQ